MACAQRPEASGRRSLGEGPVVLVVATCSTPGGIGAAITRPRMVALWAAWECSTPGGIGAAITGSSRSRHQKRHVLNARRHRGGDHSLAPSDSAPHLLCSTPGGIGAAITPKPRSVFPGGRCAQRPEASGRRSPGCSRLLASRCIRVLNARRHRGGDHRWRRVTPCARRSAQRPEASGRRSRPREPGARAAAAVLNARRHRGGDHSWPTRRRNAKAGAQRPEASGRRSPSRSAPACGAASRAQRPEASGRRSQPPEKPAKLPDVSIRQTRMSVRRWGEDKVGDGGSSKP